MPENKYYISGVERYNKGDFTGAVREFTIAIEAEPENAYFYYERGLSYLNNGNKSAALQDLNKAQELQPENPYRYSSRAYVREQLGDVKGAIEDYKITIQLDPEDAIAHNNLGILEEKLGYMQFSKQHFQKADELSKKQDHLATSENDSAHSHHDPEPGPATKTPIEETSATAKNYLKIMGSVFTSGESFKSFVSFIGNLFRKGKDK